MVHVRVTDRVCVIICEKVSVALFGWKVRVAVKEIVEVPDGERLNVEVTELVGKVDAVGEASVKVTVDDDVCVSDIVRDQLSVRDGTTEPVRVKLRDF